MNFVREEHTANILPTGMVLVIAGDDGSTNGIKTAEIHDPAAKLWTRVGDFISPRFDFVASLLTNGRVLVAGGVLDCTNEFDFCSSTSEAELFDPTTNQWQITRSMSLDRGSLAGTLLKNGVFLVSGGSEPFDDVTYASAEEYIP